MRPSPSLARPALRLALAVGLLVAGRDRPSGVAQGLAQVPPRGEVHAPLGAALDGYLRRLEAFGFSGSVLVARRGEVLVDAGYGFAVAEAEEPYTPDTLFDVASVSKQFTAAAILALEQEGRLRVEDTLARFFPGAPSDKAGITLHQLLTHTSGLPDVLGAEYEAVSRGEMLRRAFAAALVVRPGTRFRYSNAGYSVLAAVVEVISGRPLGELMRGKLFLPAGMRNTGFRLPFWDRRHLAHGYGLDGPWGTPLDHPWAPDGPFWNLRGNGGVLSTTRDLYRWHLALSGDGVLSRAEREKLLTPYVREGPHTPSSYAYGWSIAPGPDGSRVASHTGGNGVFDTDFRRYLDDQAVLIASSNRADFSAVAVAAHLENRLFGQPDPDPPAPAPIAPDRLRRCAGVYALPSGERLEVTAAARGLRISAGGPAGLALLLAGQDDDERELMEERAQKVTAALEGARRGNFAALATLFGQPEDVAARPLRAALQRFERELGAWTGAMVLGSVSADGYPYTYARLTFERGTRLAELRWEGPTVETVRYRDRPAAYLYLPERPAAAAGPDGSLHFGSYDVRTGAVARLRCYLPPRGPASRLVVEAPAGEVPVPRAAATAGQGGDGSGLLHPHPYAGRGAIRVRDYEDPGKVRGAADEDRRSPPREPLLPRRVRGVLFPLGVHAQGRLQVRRDERPHLQPEEGDGPAGQAWMVLQAAGRPGGGTPAGRWARRVPPLAGGGYPRPHAPFQGQG
jgi:CubicO group peptidase (beta-lactamase class C family)